MVPRHRLFVDSDVIVVRYWNREVDYGIVGMAVVIGGVRTGGGGGAGGVRWITQIHRQCCRILLRIWSFIPIMLVLACIYSTSNKPTLNDQQWS